MKITLIVGAGASKELNIETASELKDRIIGDSRSVDQDLVGQFFKFQNKLNVKSRISYFNETIINFRTDLRNWNGTIDSFLHQDKYSKYGEFARFAIAYHIIGAERWLMRENLYGIKPNWIKIFLENHLEKQIKSISQNKIQINIITFNYDRVIEHFLYNYLRHKTKNPIKGLENGTDDCFEFIKKFRIEHVYGKIADLEWENRENETSCVEFGARNDNPEKTKKAFKSINLIGDRVDPEIEKRIKTTIKKSDKIFFFGFNYDDDENMRILFGEEVFDKMNFKLNAKCKGTSYGINPAILKKYPFIKTFKMKCHEAINNEFFSFLN